jgi:hypothetical protein
MVEDRKIIEISVECIHGNIENPRDPNTSPPIPPQKVGISLPVIQSTSIDGKNAIMLRGKMIKR